MRPPFESFKNPICKGSILLGNACGTCERCVWEKQELARLQEELSQLAAATQLTMTLTVDAGNQVHLEVSGCDENWEKIGRAAGQVFQLDLQDALLRCASSASKAVRV